MSLPIRSRMALTLAAAHYAYPAARDTDARDLLGMSATVFHRHVGVLLDDPVALAAMPVEVRRLQRLRDRRRLARSA